MNYLVETTEIYRVESEADAKDLVEEAKRKSTVSKYSCVYKEKKAKGEVIDSWYRVTITKKWTSEKEPDSCTKVTYSVGTSFPGANDED